MIKILRFTSRFTRFGSTPPRSGIASALDALRPIARHTSARLHGPHRGVFASAAVASNQTAATAASRVAASPWRVIVTAASLGALLMYIFDPAHGRRRRALVRDRFTHAGHAVAHVRRRIERRGRFLHGVAKGVSHDAGHAVRHDRHYPLADNETLVARVRSEVLGDDRLKAGEIHVDAYEGCVTLRGQLEDVRQIQRVINATKHVDGVIEIRSYLHLPGEIPPNKAEAYRHILEELHAM